MIRKLTVVGAALLVALLWVLPASADRGFNAQSFTLKNGLQVVVFPSSRAPIVTQMVWYRVGSADEPKGKSGIAHFLEHLMFKGTPSVPAGEFSKIIARNGGRDNAFTSYDYTAFWQTIAADHLELVMKMEADRMANLTLEDSQVKPELQVVLEERRMRTDNRPSALLSEKVIDALYGPHGYGIPVIGYEPEIEKLTRADALAFYHQHYAPNNAVLLIAGDVTVPQVKALAEKYYGPLKPYPQQARTRAYSDKIHGPPRVERRDERVRQPAWSRDYLAPSYRLGDTHEAVPLQVLAEILGGNETSRLYRALVVDQKLAVAVDAGYSPTALGETTFSFSAVPAGSVSMSAIEAAMDKEIGQLLAKGVTKEELERAKARLLAANIYARDALSTGPRLYGAQLAIGRSLADINRWPADVQAVTVEQVDAAARAVLKPGRAVTSELLPQKEVGG